MQAKIVKKEGIAAGTLYVELITEEAVNFTAGQFFSLTLLNPPYTDTRGNSRFMGFVNSPTQNKTVALVTRTGPSAFKKSLQEMGIGTGVEMGKIGGEMILPEDPSRPLVVITGGIGIVPYMSILRYMEEKSLPHKITFIYTNTNRSSAIFLSELETFTQENPNIKLVATMTQDKDWPGEKRRIDEQFLKGCLTLDNSIYYVSGTPRFVPAIVKILRNLGVTPPQMKFEIFTGYQS